MKAIVGLGNPGKRYISTRHNFGFMVLDRLAEKANINFKPGKGDWIYSKFDSETLLIKPTSYMNNSGFSIVSACNYFDIKNNNLLLIYDDIDLSLGTLKFKEKGFSGGHKGVENVIYQLGSNEFPRLKLGIANDGVMRPSEKFVLQPFRNDEKTIINETINIAADALDYYLINGIRKTMNYFNKKPIIGKGENG